MRYLSTSMRSVKRSSTTWKDFISYSYQDPIDFSPVSTEELFCINIWLLTLFSSHVPCTAHKQRVWLHFRWRKELSFFCFCFSQSANIILIANEISRGYDILRQEQRQMSNKNRRNKERSSLREIYRIGDVVSQSPKWIQRAIFSFSCT